MSVLSVRRVVHVQVTPFPIGRIVKGWVRQLFMGRRGPDPQAARIVLAFEMAREQLYMELHGFMPGLAGAPDEREKWKALFRAQMAIVSDRVVIKRITLAVVREHLIAEAAIHKILTAYANACSPVEAGDAYRIVQHKLEKLLSTIRVKAPHT